MIHSNSPTDNNIKTISNTVSTPVSTSHSAVTHPRHYQRNELHTYIIDNSDACLNEPVDLLIISISKSGNYKTRDAIRRTWGSGKNLGEYSSINVKFFFLIDVDENLSESIRLESNIFHDIIQVKLPQQYTLVTHRVLSLFEWSFRYCRTAKFLFKTDDDIFINFILLLKFVSSLLPQPIDNSFVTSEMNIYGYAYINATVFRSATDLVGRRYIMTHDEYPCRTYPDYLTGFGYLIPKKARDAIVYAAYLDLEPFRISDIYFTGIIPEYLSISRRFMSNYDVVYEGDCKTFFNNSNAFACPGGSHHGDSDDIFANFNIYWQLIKKQHGLIH